MLLPYAKYQTAAVSADALPEPDATAAR
jgi:hypothetical protein